MAASFRAVTMPAVGILAFACRAVAVAPSPEEIEFFETKVRTVFADHCYPCHSELAPKVKGGLRLDSTAALLKGGTSGPAVIPHDPDASLLIKAIRYTDPDLQMPPKGKKLAADQIASLEAWVRIGAPLPSSPGAPNKMADISKARTNHWAF